MTPLASSRVRTNGIISLTLVRPISLRTKDSASHSRSKQSRKDGSRYREAPRKPIIGFSSCGS